MSNEEVKASLNVIFSTHTSVEALPVDAFAPWCYGLELSGTLPHGWITFFGSHVLVAVLLLQSSTSALPAIVSRKLPGVGFFTHWQGAWAGDSTGRDMN